MLWRASLSLALGSGAPPGPLLFGGAVVIRERSRLGGLSCGAPLTSGPTPALPAGPRPREERRRFGPFPRPGRAVGDPPRRGVSCAADR